MFTARIGYVITTGATAELAQSRAEQAVRALGIQITPRTAGETSRSGPNA